MDALNQYRDLYLTFMGEIATNKNSYELRYALKEANNAIERNAELTGGKLSNESLELIRIVEALYKSILI